MPNPPNHNNSMPALYNQIWRDLHITAQQRQAGALHALNSAIEWRRDAAQALSDFTTGYLVTGIAQQELPVVQLGNLMDNRRNFNWERYLWELSRQVHRPFVYVSYSTWAGNMTAYVRIERAKYCDPLVSRFLLLPKHHHGLHLTRWWQFHVPQELLELVTNWIEECRTDPVLRKALRLT